MKILYDYQNMAIRLTDERLAHVLEHPEMVGLEHAIEETLKNPDQVVQSASDAEVRLYYRLYHGTQFGDKYICVIVKVLIRDTFVLTAYLTDTVKKGELIWAPKS